MTASGTATNSPNLALLAGVSSIGMLGMLAYFLGKGKKAEEMTKEEKNTLLLVQLLLQVVEKNNALEAAAVKYVTQATEGYKREDEYRKENARLEVALKDAQVEIDGLHTQCVQRHQRINDLQAELAAFQMPKPKKCGK